MGWGDKTKTLLMTNLCCVHCIQEIPHTCYLAESEQVYKHQSQGCLLSQRKMGRWVLLVVTGKRKEKEIVTHCWRATRRWIYLQKQKTFNFTSDLLTARADRRATWLFRLSEGTSLNILLFLEMLTILNEGGRSNISFCARLVSYAVSPAIRLKAANLKFL